LILAFGQRCPKEHDSTQNQSPYHPAHHILPTRNLLKDHDRCAS
jgi:hypothetical protein